MSGPRFSTRCDTGLRLIAVAFCWATATYAFMSASPFAYRQFLLPRVFAWVGTFSDWHAWLYWPWLGLAVPREALRANGPVRWLAVAFAACWLLVGAAVTVHPILPSLTDDFRSIIVGIVALVPVLWLALIDYAGAELALLPACEPKERLGGPPNPSEGGKPRATPSGLVTAAARRWSADNDDGRLFMAAIGTAVFVTVVNAAQTPIAMGGAFEPDLLTKGLAWAFAWSLIDHVVIFCGVFLVAAVTARAAGTLGFTACYACCVVFIALLLSVLIQRTMCDALGFSGWPSALVAMTLASSLAATWGAIRLRWTRQREIVSPLDLLFGPSGRAAIQPRRLIPLAVLAVAAYAIGAVSRVVDWDFLLLKFGVFALWMAAFDLIYRLCPRRHVPSAAIAFTCLAPLTVYAAAVSGAESRLVPRHALDRYAVYNPSFRVADGLLRDATAAGDDSFQRFLRANTGLGSGVDVSPRSIDFAPPGVRAETTPFIFLFVVDSLRRDYLQPYNGAVTFTPNLERFARESLVFQHAFTAYGGTGLSLPAIWSGSVGVHKQYVLPFAPMNALEKLLDANGYRRFLSVDSIARQILTPSRLTTELDQGLRNEDFSFCRTAGELQTRLGATAGDSRPVFAYSLPQDLHISNIISASVPAGESYPGFHGPYASRVHHIDRCFGEFIDFLKRRGWYDRSVVVITADHGEMLGEDGVWGHVYYLYPPVVEIPLIVHLPKDTPSPMVADVEGLSMTTDITPTLYAALGYPPILQRGLSGRRLLASAGTDFQADREGRPEVLAASYSAVYAVLGSNGSRLYIVDAVQHREYAYARDASRSWKATRVTAGIREVGQRLIREHLYAINQAYRVTPRP